jgi:putative phosphoribosyl transferase
VDGYRDRREAGGVLAEALAHHRSADPLVLGVARGGVVVAAVVAKALGGTLDVVVARKVGAPFSPELALGAVADGGVSIIEREMADRLGVAEAELEEAIHRARTELAQRQSRYRGDASPGIAGRTVIVVDDGVATGATLRAALRSVRNEGPAHLVCAVPVGPPSTVDLLIDDADEVVCPLQPLRFRAVGEWYRQFDQTSDAEVLGLLGR